MILKSELQTVFESQQERVVQAHPAFVQRDCLDWMKSTGKQVEVISGIRRCGKSTLMQILMDSLKQEIAYFNFEDTRIHGFEVRDFQKLDEIIGVKHPLYFFDEIQNIPSWEIFIRQLHDRGEKVFITGSNASLLSKELGTRLTGRYLRHELFPFSYQEYLIYNRMEDSPKNFETYLFKGGFPEYLRDNNPEVLNLLLKDIVYRDIAVRYGIRNPDSLLELTLFLLSNIGKPVTFNKLKTSFQFGSANTVSDYISWLEDCYLIFLLPRFSWSARVTAVNARKVYGIDNGLIHVNSLSYSKDEGRLLENLVFLHLKKSGKQLFYFKEEAECDFVLMENKKATALIQVCSILNSDTLDRELRGLQEAMRFFAKKEGIIVTMDLEDQLETADGKVKVVPIRQLLQMAI